MFLFIFFRFLLDLLLLPVLPVVVAWARREEARVLRAGTPLSPLEDALAHAAGVREASRVRVLAAQRVPTPLPRVLQRLVERLGLISPHIAAMTLGHAIVFRQDCRDDVRMLAHELTHVAQYERLGGIAGFMRPYLRECVWPGYPRGPLEREAQRGEALAEGHAAALAVVRSDDGRRM